MQGLTVFRTRVRRVPSYKSSPLPFLFSSLFLFHFRFDFLSLSCTIPLTFVHLTAPTEFPHCGTKWHNSNCPRGTDARLEFSARSYRPDNNSAVALENWNTYRLCLARMKIYKMSTSWSRRLFSGSVMGAACHDYFYLRKYARKFYLQCSICNEIPRIREIMTNNTDRQ